VIANIIQATCPLQPFDTQAYTRLYAVVAAAVGCAAFETANAQPDFDTALVASFKRLELDFEVSDLGLNLAAAISRHLLWLCDF
jgi:hypothetical protein